MRKNFGAKEMCYPMPVFIIGTYNEDGTTTVETLHENGNPINA